MTYSTLNVAFEGGVCRIAFARPQAHNAINAEMVADLTDALALCAAENGPDGMPVTVVILEGDAQVFCSGGDFDAIAENGDAGDPEPLYAVWQLLAEGPFATIALVRGRTNAGGVGFVASCDIVIADKTASFALSELLFGLFPSCVLPFLIRRVGHRHAHLMTLTTRSLNAQEAVSCGLVDIVSDDMDDTLRKTLLRLKHLRKAPIARYKTYMASCRGEPEADKTAALAANRAFFSDPEVISAIRRYVTEMKFPWEA